MNTTILIIMFLFIVTVFTVPPIFGDEEPKIIISEIDGRIFTAAINSTIIATNGTVIGKVEGVNPSEVGKVFVLEQKNLPQNSNNNENLNMSIALFTGVAVPIILLLYQSFRSKRILVNQNSESLIKEIDSNEGALTGKQNYPIVKYTGLDDKKSSIKYTNAFLDYESYENLINSGQFSYFVPDTQFSLRELYTRIKDHYRTMKYIDELEDKFKLAFPKDEKEFLKAVVKYEVSLTLWESEILELIPQTKNKLKTEIKFIL